MIECQAQKKEEEIIRIKHGTESDACRRKKNMPLGLRRHNTDVKKPELHSILFLKSNLVNNFLNKKKTLGVPRVFLYVKEV